MKKHRVIILLITFALAFSIVASCNQSDPSMPSDEKDSQTLTAKANASVSQNIIAVDEETFRFDYADEVVRLVNLFRSQEGKSPLKPNESLHASARLRAKELVQKFDHTRPDGTPCHSSITVSYMAAGENIAEGQKTPDEVMSSWENSEGHRDNMLSDDFDGIGVGCYEKDGILYWVQLFIGEN